MSAETFKFRSKMRGVVDDSVTVLTTLATLIVIAPLVAIFGYLLYKGASSLNLAFFTQVPKPPARVRAAKFSTATVGSTIAASAVA